MQFLPKEHNMRGMIPLVLLYVAAAVILVLFFVFGSFPIKDKLLGGLFPQLTSQAAGTVDLELIPNTVSVAKDQTFLVDVAINAKADQPSAMLLAIDYDPQVLQAVTAEQGFFFTEDLDPVTPKIGSGKIQMTLGQKPNQYKSGNGIIATLEFKALKATTPTSAISFDATNTQIAAIAKTGNQVGLLTPSVVTVSNTPIVTPTAEFSLSAPTSATTGQQFNLLLRAKSPEAANLFASSLNFDPALLEVVSISTTGSFVTQWVNDNAFDNMSGQISLIGGVPTPGYTNSSAATMATIVLKAKAAGSAIIGFGANSAIYRNSDNKNILVTPIASSTVTVTGVAPSPSPSVAPSPSVTPVPSPSAVASIAPSPSAAASVAPSASPSVAPSASPSATPIACAITSANWVTTTNPVTQGKVVGLNVIGSANCAGQTVSFNVLEDDNVLGVGGTDPVRNTPPSTKFNSSNVATSNWLAEYQDDPSIIENNVPEYFFRAILGSGHSVVSANPMLKVLALGGGIFLSGDVDKSGGVDLVDLSVLLSNWNKTADFIDTLDLNQDGQVNTIDWSTMIQILKVTEVIK